MNDPNLQFASSLRSTPGKSPARRSSLTVSSWYSPQTAAARQHSSNALASTSSRVMGVDVSSFRETSNNSNNNNNNTASAKHLSLSLPSPQRERERERARSRPPLPPRDESPAPMPAPALQPALSNYRSSLWDPPSSCQRRLLPGSQYKQYFPVELTDRDYLHRLVALLARAVQSLERGLLRQRESAQELVGPAEELLNLIIAHCASERAGEVTEKFILFHRQSSSTRELVNAQAGVLLRLRDAFAAHISGWSRCLLDNVHEMFSATKSLISAMIAFSSVNHDSSSSAESARTYADRLLQELRDLQGQYRIHREFQQQRLRELRWEKPVVDAEPLSLSPQTNGERDADDNGDDFESVTRRARALMQRAENDFFAPERAARVQLIVRLLQMVQDLQILSTEASHDRDYAEAQRLGDIFSAVDDSFSIEDRLFADEAALFTQQLRLCLLDLQHAAAKTTQAMELRRTEALQTEIMRTRELHDYMASLTSRCSLLLAHDDVKNRIRAEGTEFICADFLFSTQFREDELNIGSLLVMAGAQDILQKVQTWPGLTQLSRERERRQRTFSAEEMSSSFQLEAPSPMARSLSASPLPDRAMTLSSLATQSISHSHTQSHSHSQWMLNALRSFEALRTRLDDLLTPISVAHSELLCRLVGMRVNLLQLVEINTHRGNIAEQQRLDALASVLDETVDADEQDLLEDDEYDALLGRGKKRIDGIWQLTRQVNDAAQELHKLKLRARSQSDYTAAQAFESMERDLRQRVEEVERSIQQFNMLDVDNDSAVVEAMDVSERVAREGTEFLTSNYLFSFSCGPKGHSVGSLAIVAGAGAVLRFIKAHWPDLSALGNAHNEAPPERTGSVMFASSADQNTQFASSSANAAGMGETMGNSSSDLALRSSLLSRRRSTLSLHSPWMGTSNPGASNNIDFRDPNALRLMGFDAKSLKCAGFSDVDILTAGFSAEQLRQAGFNADAIFHAAGLSAQAVQSIGFDLDILVDVLHDLFVTTNGPSWRKNAVWNELPSFVATLHHIKQEKGSNSQKRAVIMQLLRRMQGVSMDLQAAEIERLVITKNNLSGFIPSHLSSLNSLKQLVLGENMLCGEIPSSLGMLVNLEVLCLDHNLLEGEIPRTFKSLHNLLVLRLEHNRLSGLLPASLANLSKLRRLDVSHNQLSGCLPQKLGVGMTKIQEILLGNNYFSGEIPSSWINMSQLTHLELQGNQLTGSLPMNYQKWTKLTGLNIQNNAGLIVDRHHLQKSLPKCRIKK